MKRTPLPPRSAPLSRSNKRIRKVNPEAKAKRDARYKKYLSSAAWKKLRLAVFERDGFRCTNKRGWDPCIESLDEYCATTGDELRCPNEDESRRGTGLVADHLTYARFGHENLEDLRTLCRPCNARLTVSERANWRR